jgi:P27 family predicted phage terminase small subunit
MSKDHKDGLAGALLSVQNASKVLRPTRKLSDSAMAHFVRVVDSRESETWSPNDLSLATMLADAYDRMDDLTNLLDQQGYVQINDKGTQISNPIFTALTQTVHQVQSMNKTLGLSAPQRGLNDREQRKRNEADMVAKDAIRAASQSDGLLA